MPDGSPPTGRVLARARDGRLVFTRKERPGQRPHQRGLFPKGSQRSLGLLGEFCGNLPRAGQAEQSGIGRLGHRSVFACGFAQFFGGLRDIKNVVDDLEGESE